MHFQSWCRSTIAVLTVLGAVGFVPTTALMAQAGSPGSITGKVSYSGERPAPEVVSIRQDQDVCGSESRVLKVEGENGGLKNAVVRIVDIDAPPPQEFDEPVLDQTGCVFGPPVVLVAPSQELRVLNNDGIMHNVHTRPEENRGVNKSMPKFLKEIKLRFRAPEIIPVVCDVHSWMHANIVVAEHAYYAVTDADGAFELPNVPDGTYTLEAWHPELGTKAVQVQVAGGQVEATIAF